MRVEAKKIFLLAELVIVFGCILYLFGLFLFMYAAILLPPDWQIVLIVDALMPYETYLLIPILIGYLLFRVFQIIKKI